MTEVKGNETKTGKKLNPLPFLIIALIFVVIAIVYYASPLSKPAPAAETPVPSVTPRPTVVTVIEDKPEKTKLTAAEVKAVLEPAADLITSRYHYTNAADFDSVLTWFGSTLENPFTHSKGYIMYDGIVSVGISMDEVTFDIDNEEQKITVHLPKPKILAHEIDDSSVKSDTKESIFNSLDAEYYAKLIDGLKESTEQKVLNDASYLKEVRRNTELVFTNFFSASEALEGFTVEYTD